MKKITTIELSKEDIESLIKEKFGDGHINFIFGLKTIPGGDVRDPPRTKSFLKGLKIKLG